jgi:hypothetical protein
MNSSNGTYVNDKKLDANTNTELQSGDALQLGVDVKDNTNNHIVRIAFWFPCPNLYSRVCCLHSPLGLAENCRCVGRSCTAPLSARENEGRC